MQKAMELELALGLVSLCSEAFIKAGLYLFVLLSKKAVLA